MCTWRQNWSQSLPNHSGNERRRVVAARATMPAASRYLPIECHEPLARCKHKGVGSWRAHACGGAATRHPHVCHKTSARTGCWKPGHVGRNMIPARRPFFAKIGPPRRNHISALAKLRPEFGRNLVGRHSLMGLWPWGNLQLYAVECKSLRNLPALGSNVE